MAACPRAEIVYQGEVGVYHVWTRCVRRAFLCGNDPFTGRDYEYRRQWIHGFQQQLAGLFGVEIGFHAELSNHLHLVLRARPDVVATWSDEEVARRQLTIDRLVKSKDGCTISEVSDAEIALETADADRIVELRERLSSISFFMKALCEHIGRRANREDGCTGRFFEGRFGCRWLADEAAIFVCGIYVDLNQISSWSDSASMASLGPNSPPSSTVVLAMWWVELRPWRRVLLKQADGFTVAKPAARTPSAKPR